ncbi:MAG: NERD domain-containing protein [Tetragenococcus koreensis]|nr:NERD domain-containing protein [Tetragenococcus koreensis]
MGLFNKLTGPVFLKESYNAEVQLKKLKALEEKLDEKGKDIVRRDIKYLEYGIAGEKNIAFELKNSHLPMYVIHDIYLEWDGYSAQIDYMIFTKKLCFIIECKNLYGNITINSTGDFIRTIQYKGRKKREGIYSPITQNQRHMDLIKLIRCDHRNNKVTKALSNVLFKDIYKPVVVLANPKTVLNARYAKKEVKQKIVRADQLINDIKKANNDSKEWTISDKKMLADAQFYLDVHKAEEKDYTSKYDRYKRDATKQVITKNDDVTSGKEHAKKRISSINNLDLYNDLKAYRLTKSWQEGIKAFYVFSDKQLKALIEAMPRNKADLYLVKGFGETKVGKYGENIIQIIEKYDRIK